MIREIRILAYYVGEDQPEVLPVRLHGNSKPWQASIVVSITVVVMSFNPYHVIKHNSGLDDLITVPR